MTMPFLICWNTEYVCIIIDETFSFLLFFLYFKLTYYLQAHVNLIDEEDGLTPLIVASGRGFTKIVEKLIAYDAQVQNNCYISCYIVL